MNQNYLEVFIGPFCKKDCLFCNEGGFGKRSFTSFENFESILEKNSLKKIVLTGGEPLLNPRILEYIVAGYQSGASISLVTACTERLSADFLKSLIDAGLSEIMISLEGPEKIHDILVQEEGAYKEIISVLSRLAKIERHNLRVIIHTNINKVNYKHIPFFIHRILQEFPFIYTYHLQMLEPFGSAIKNRALLFDRYSTLIQPFFENISKIQLIEKVKFGRLPLCLVSEKHHDFIAQTPEIYEDEAGIIGEGGYAGSKYESDLCSGCTKDNKCDKFFKHYIDMFSDAEIKAFIK